MRTKKRGQNSSATAIFSLHNKEFFHVLRHVPRHSDSWWSNPLFHLSRRLRPADSLHYGDLDGRSPISRHGPKARRNQYSHGLLHIGTVDGRSDGRRVGNECVGTRSSRWSRALYTKKK